LLAALLATQAGLTVLATTRQASKAYLLHVNDATYLLLDHGSLPDQVRALSFRV